MTRSLGQLTLDLIARTGGFTGPLDRASRQAERNFKKIEREGKAAAKSLTVLGAAAAAAGGVIVGRVVRETAAFEDALLGLEAVSQATTYQMKELEQQARTLGATSMFSAQQAADAQRFLAMAGFEVNEILSATPGLLDLAAAGQLNLAQAADIASNVLGGMRMEVEELSRVNDVLAAAASGANTNIMQLGQALSYAAPFAAAAGISIEEAAAAIGAMSDAGIQASRAGTGLVGVIRGLSKITPTASRALAAVGLSAEDVSIEAHGLQRVLDTLSQAGLSVGQAIEIFGSEAGAAALNVIEASDSISEFTKELGNSEGAAKRMANVIGSGLTGSLLSFNSMISEALIRLGRDEGIAGGFQAVVDTGSGVLAVYNDMLPEFAEANDLTADQADNLTSLAGGLQAVATIAGSAAGGILAYRTAIAAAAVAQWAFNAAAMANPIGAVIAVASAAAGALYHYREELGLVDVAAQNAADAIAASAGAIQAGSKAAIDANYDNLINSLEAVSLQAQEAMAQLVELEARQRFYENSHQGIADSVAGAVDQQTAALARLWERQVELQRAIRENRAAREGLNSAESEAAETGEVLINVNRDLSEVSSEAARQAEQLESAYESLLDRLYPIEASQRRFREEMGLLDLAAQAGKVHDLADAQERLLQSFGSDQDWQSAYGFEGLSGGGEGGSYWDRWLESAELALTDFDQLAANTAENFQRGFGNAFESMVFDSQSLGDAMYNLTEGIARSMVSALGEMAAQWLAYQAVQMMVGRTTQSSAASTMITNAMAQQQMAGLNAFSSTAAIPIVGPFMAPGAMAAAIAATSPSVSAISSLAVAGMAHDGIDSIPREGTWLLDKGERVLNAPQASKLDRFLDQQQAQDRRRDGVVTVNIIENPERAGQRETTVGADGREEESLFVADIYGDGPRSRAIQNAFGLQRRGR